MLNLSRRLNGKSLLTLALSVQLATGALVLQANAATYLSDINNHWAGNAIQTLVNDNVIGGYPDGTFRPEGIITRAEFAAVLSKALNLSANASGSAFYDVPSSHWAYPSIMSVQSAGLISGYPNGGFAPARTINRAESMVVLAKAARLQPLNMSEANQVLQPFADQYNVADWAKPYVGALVKANLFTNEPNRQGYIDATQPASRAEVASILNRVDTYLANNGNLPSNMNNNVANNNQNNQNNTSSSQIQGRVVSIPAQTKLSGTIDTTVDTSYNKVGDQISLTLSQAITSGDGSVIIPTQSKVVGTITEIEPAGRAGKNASLAFDFNQLVLPNGERYQIQAGVANEEGKIKAGTGGERATEAVIRTAAGAGLGAALGTAAGPLSGGSVGKGAIYGTALGAGVGAVAAILNKGDEVVLRPGAPIEINLQTPLLIPMGATQQQQNNTNWNN